MVKAYYQDKAVTLYHGDCREIVPHLGKFDLLLTDPPYGIGADKKKAHSSIRDNPKWPKTEWDNKAAELPLLLGLVFMASKSIIWGGNYFGLPPQSGWIAWIKPEAGTGFSMADLELGWTNLEIASRCKMLPRRDGNEHPTQKPVDLMIWIIGLAGEVSTILDPFAGSGTTGRAAKDLGRKCTLIEREEKYCEIAAKRLSQEVFNLQEVAA